MIFFFNFFKILDIWASLALFLAETGALVIWFVIYSFEWNYWGPFGENISIFYPRG